MNQLQVHEQYHITFFLLKQAKGHKQEFKEIITSRNPKEVHVGL